VEDTVVSFISVTLHKVLLILLLFLFNFFLLFYYYYLADLNRMKHLGELDCFC
jgi:hypothetical protein